MLYAFNFVQKLRRLGVSDFCGPWPCKRMQIPTLSLFRGHFLMLIFNLTLLGTGSTLTLLTSVGNVFCVCQAFLGPYEVEPAGPKQLYFLPAR